MGLVEKVTLLLRTAGITVAPGAAELEPLHCPSMLTSDEIEAALNAGDEHRLIDESESEVLDFKEQPYVLITDKGRWELAKDVAALANSGGGCLVIGVGTIKPGDRSESWYCCATKPARPKTSVCAPLGTSERVYPPFTLLAAV